MEYCCRCISKFNFLKQMNDHMGGLSTLLEKMRGIVFRIKVPLMWSNHPSDPKCGIEVKNRTWHARTYEACFVGSEAVDWMVRTLELPSREDAVAIGKILSTGFFKNKYIIHILLIFVGQSLMYRGIIQHVCNSEPFADHFFFYSFTEVLSRRIPS